MQARRSFGSGDRRSREPVDVRAVLGGDNLPRLWDLVDAGALVSVSSSRDRGAIAVTVFSDGKNEREWFRNAGEAAMWLDEILGLLAPDV